MSLQSPTTGVGARSGKGGGDDIVGGIPLGGMKKLRTETPTTKMVIRGIAREWEEEKGEKKISTYCLTKPLLSDEH